METVTPLPDPERLRDICGQIARSVTRQISEILLEPGLGEPEDEVCTVYTSFERGFPFTLDLVADLSLFRRLTQRMMRREQVSAQDVEDAAKEYFNVVCGGIVAALYRATGQAGRFRIPSFCRGFHQPEEGLERNWEAVYLGDRDERARLVCYMAPQETMKQ